MVNYCYENCDFMEENDMDVMFSNKELVEILKGLIEDDNFEDNKNNDWFRIMYVKRVHKRTIVIGHEIERTISLIFEKKYWDVIESSIKNYVEDYYKVKVNVIYEPKYTERVTEWDYLKDEVQEKWDSPDFTDEDDNEVTITFSDEDFDNVIHNVVFKYHISMANYKAWLIPLFFEDVEDNSIWIGHFATEREADFIRRKYLDLLTAEIKEYVLEKEDIDVNVVYNPELSGGKLACK